MIMANFLNLGKKKKCNSPAARGAKKIKMEEKQSERRAKQEANFFARKRKRSVA